MRCHPVLILLALCAVLATGCQQWTYVGPDGISLSASRFLTDASAESISASRTNPQTGDTVTLEVTGLNSETQRVADIVAGVVAGTLRGQVPATPDTP